MILNDLRVLSKIYQHENSVIAAIIGLLFVLIVITENILKHITPEDLAKALNEQERSGGELSKVLIKLKMIDENILAQVLSEGLGLPPINISVSAPY